MHNTRLRTFGVILLILGISSAGIVYRLESRSQNRNDDPSMTGYSRQETRQMETLYGTMGGMTDDLLNALKRPGVQAAVIAGISVLVAGGCFYFSRPAINDGKKGRAGEP